ncbi:MAG: KH domain-containing protein [Patescibacteria group bacterium]|nr:KH domain-containing protein [Patescibacteria group bacterium]
MERDAQFVEEVVKMLVDNPDDVKVDRKVDEMGVLISLDVNQEDMGMVIGREGSTAKALRTLLRVVGARNNARVNLKINEPEGSDRPARKEREEADSGEKEQKTLDEVVGDIQI